MPEMIQMLDENALLWIQDAVRVPILDPFVEIFTSLGNAGVLWIVLSLGMLCWRPTRRAGGTALLAMALGMLCTNVILKQLVLRPRPYVTMEALIPLLTSADPNSFPSGHTCAAFAAGMAWAGALPWRWARAAAVVQAVCMGLSRLYVGVHYPSDVLAGALIGGLCALCALWLAARSRDRRRAVFFSAQASGAFRTAACSSSQAVSWTRPSSQRGKEASART